MSNFVISNVLVKQNLIQFCLIIIIAFDKVERKPNFDLWLSRVGIPA